MPDPYGNSRVRASVRTRSRARAPFAGAVLLFMAVATAAFLNSPYFSVENVEVTGARYLSADEVRMIAGVPRLSNIFLVPVRDVEARLKATPRIAKATVKRLFPQALLIEVEERGTAVQMPYAGYFIDIDAQGSAIAVVEAITDPDIPLLVGVKPTYVSVGEAVKPEGPVQLGAAVGQALARRKVPMLSEVDVSQPDSVVVRTSDGIKILLGAEAGIELRINVADSILASVREQGAKVDYIDVRVETRPVMGTDNRG